MRWFAAPDYWFARLAFQRGLAARLYRYRFTTWRELRETGAWWQRSGGREYMPPVTRRARDRVI